MPQLAARDPVTGDVIRAVRQTPNRYERERPGELAHIDVKKLGRVPDGGGWRAHGRSEKGATAAGSLLRAAEYFAAHGIPKIERVPSDNAFAYRRSAAFKDAVARLGAEQRFIKPHCPWTNGKVERFNRTKQTEWAYRHVFTSNQDRHNALAPFIEHYNTSRIHSSHGLTPATRVSPT